MSQFVRKYSFWEIGEYKQQISKNEAEAKRNLECSCARCRKAGICNESICPIYRAHKLKLLMLEAKNIKVNSPIFVKTRKYKTNNTKQHHAQAMRLLTKLYKNEMSKTLELKLDEASIYLELDEFEKCIDVLLKIKAIKTAKKIAELVRRKGYLQKILK